MGAQPFPGVYQHLLYCGYVSQPDIATELLASAAAASPRARLTYSHTTEAVSSVTAPWPQWVSPTVREYFATDGIEHLWQHQARAADSIAAGEHTVLATGTSSGKSLAYQLPILQTLATTPATSALYLTPTKALANDQLHRVQRLIAGIEDYRDIAAASYDGDTASEIRRIVRDQAHWVFTNPDMLHLSLLGAHRQWGRLWRNLRYIVIDEGHSYRGVFGAHIAQVVRRALRVAALYGAQPTIIAASATMRDPVAHAQRLTGIPAAQWTCCDTDHSPHGRRTLALWEPPTTPLSTHPDTADSTDADSTPTITGAEVARSATTEAAIVVATMVLNGARTLVFVRSRRSAETVADAVREHLRHEGRPDLEERIAAYRAGYLAEDRRALERGLDNGDLLAVATTNALELGIDVGGLDCVVICGYPGTIASFRQQAGRAGRRGQSSLVMFVARSDPMDTYLINHPAALVQRPIEQTIFDPHNPYVTLAHTYCAAVEFPLTESDVKGWQRSWEIQLLTQVGLLRRRSRGWYPTLNPTPSVAALSGDDAAGLADVDWSTLTPQSAHLSVQLRGGSASDVAIVESATSRLIGTVDGARAHSTVHDGAVYIHQGQSYVIDHLDLDEDVAWAHPQRPPYTTWARQDTRISIRGTRSAEYWKPGCHRALVAIEVETQVMEYTKRRPNGEVLAVVPLEYPAQRLNTVAVAYTLTEVVLSSLGLDSARWPGALHGAEHAAIGMLPLIATCDRWDLGGLSTVLHADTQLPTVFVYDGYPGGAGFAECGYERFQQWMSATMQAVANCPCEAGCPSCVQSPKCGNGNDPLDKAGAIAILRYLSQSDPA